MPEENSENYNWDASKMMIQIEGLEIGVLNDPEGMFKKFKEESDKAIDMYKKASKKKNSDENIKN